MKCELSKYIIASLKIVTIKCVYLLLLQEKCVKTSTRKARTAKDQQKINIATFK